MSGAAPLRCLGLSALALALALMYFPAKASAQFSLDLIFGTDFSMEITPAHPAPGESVRATAHSSLINLSAATLVWKIDGKTAREGVGAVDMDAEAGPLGSETRLTVTALGEGLELASAEAILRPAELDLLWEADSYVPPFYRGRALSSAGTTLRLQAIPRFVRGKAELTPRDLIFTWKRNGYVVAEASGRGKSTAVIEGSLFGPDTISVEVKTPDGVLVREERASIASRDPSIVLYQNHPVFGITYHRAFASENQIAGTEESFTAIPYFAQVRSLDDLQLRYEWKVNGIDIENDEARPSTITINAGASTEPAQIDLSLSHAANLFFGEAGTWSFLFNSRNAGIPFGGPNQ